VFISLILGNYDSNLTGLATLRELQRELSFLRTRLDQNEDRLEQTAARVECLEDTVASDRAKTIMILADHCERLDHHSNMAKSHCVLITGILKFRLRLSIRKHIEKFEFYRNGYK
jgi:hypothetical protein